ncbi:MAG: transcriptional repressor [Clostridia bacterium]|nr:transcriptional repressor [Clostridia bacterium]
MTEKQSYNTKSRQYILNYLKANINTTVSVGDILEYLRLNGISVNFTTVYRYLNKLTLEKKVIKFTGENGQKSLYQLVREQSSCEEHIHIQCVSCGKLIHLNCGFMDELRSHLKHSHDFDLKCHGSVLYGLCRECNKK